MKTEYKVNNKKIELVQGSITRYPAQALVCPTNRDLSLVAGPMSIQYAFVIDGGMEIFEEAGELREKLGEVKECSATLTNAGNLKADYVIHTVSVGWDSKKEELYCDKDIIRKSVHNVLELANHRDIISVGFPALGTGLYQVPLEEVVETIVRESAKHLRDQTSVERIGLVLYSVDSYLTGKKITDEMISPHTKV